MSDLSLIPLEDLVEEIGKRSDYYALVMCKHESGNIPVVRCRCSKKVWAWEVGLAQILVNDILNNYKGEQEPKGEQNEP